MITLSFSCFKEFPSRRLNAPPNTATSRPAGCHFTSRKNVCFGVVVSREFDKSCRFRVVTPVGQTPETGTCSSQPNFSVLHPELNRALDFTKSHQNPKFFLPAETEALMDWMDVWKEIKNMDMKHNESVKTSPGIFSPTSAGLGVVCT